MLRRLITTINEFNIRHYIHCTNDVYPRASTEPVHNDKSQLDSNPTDTSKRE